MIAPDVNILVYAHRDDEVRVHRAARRWLEDLIAGPQPFALSVLVAVAFVRIVTNLRIYKTPTPLPAALAAIDHIAAQPTCRIIAPTPDHWHRVAELCRVTRATGKLVADAQHAAVAISEGCTWTTCDADFGRFALHGLSWKHLVIA